MQERCNSIANVLELCLSCINPSIWFEYQSVDFNSLALDGVVVILKVKCFDECWIKFMSTYCHEPITETVIARFMGTTWSTSGPRWAACWPMNFVIWETLDDKYCFRQFQAEVIVSHPILWHSKIVLQIVYLYLNTSGNWIYITYIYIHFLSKCNLMI